MRARTNRRKRVELKTETAKHGTQTRNNQKKGYQNRTRNAKHELTFGEKKNNAGERKKRLRVRFASEGYMCDACIASFSRVCLCALCGGSVGVPWSGLRRVEEEKKRVSLEEEEE
jgi:hypothetical protein